MGIEQVRVYIGKSLWFFYAKNKDRECIKGISYCIKMFKIQFV